MFFEILRRWLFLLAALFFSQSAFAEHPDLRFENNNSVESSSTQSQEPPYVDGEQVRASCDLRDFDYNKIERANTGPYISRLRQCISQTGGLVVSLKGNIKVCEKAAQACFQTARMLGSTPEMVKQCHLASAYAENEISEATALYGRLQNTNKSCKDGFAEQCKASPNSPYCDGTNYQADQPKRPSGREKLAAKIEKVQQRVERFEENAEAVNELANIVREGKELIGGKPETSSGNTNIQQSYGPGSGYLEYQNSRVAANDSSGDAPLAAPKSSENPSTSSSFPTREAAQEEDSDKPSSNSKSNTGSLEGLKNLGRSVQNVVTNNEVLATTGLLRNQYLEKKEAKKSQHERQLALAQANAASSQLEVQNNLLKIKEDKSAGAGGGSRPESNSPTGVGQGVRSAGNANEKPVASGANGNPSKDFSPAGAASTATGAVTTKATGKAAATPGANSSQGQAAGTSASGANVAAAFEGPNENLKKYTKDRGFFGALARAFGFNNKKEGPKAAAVAGISNQDQSGGTQVGSATQVLQKRWNQSLGRVEMGTARGLASVDQNEVGITEKHRSIFGSICNRYTAFRKESQLGAGRAVCPGN